MGKELLTWRMEWLVYYLITILKTRKPATILCWKCIWSEPGNFDQYCVNPPGLPLVNGNISSFFGIGGCPYHNHPLPNADRSNKGELIRAWSRTKNGEVVYGIEKNKTPPSLLPERNSGMPSPSMSVT